MPNLPTPIRAALGLAATAVDEARKLPETLPQAVTTVPLMAVSTAMQASMKLQQHIATLAARGDEVLSQLRGSSAEAPSWATFDDSPAGGADSANGVADDPQAGKAAFDLIDYDNTGFAEGSEVDAGKGRWDAVGVGGTETQPDPTIDGRAPEFDTREDDSGVTATPPSAAGPNPPPPDLAEAVSAPELPARAKAGRATASSAQAGSKKAAAKAGPAKEGPAKSDPATASPAKSGPATASPAKASPATASPAKASPAKSGPATASPAKAGPAKAAKRPGRKEPDHEPLEVAARKAKPSPTPNPATMAAEILQAHVAAADDE
ncbi:MAG: hypothetical protein ABI047_03915 [Jatrophihabitantaceae bacterium]